MKGCYSFRHLHITTVCVYFMSCKMNYTLLSMYSTCKWELEPCQSQICTGCCDGKNGYYIANTTCPVFDWHLHILWKHLCCHAVQSNSIYFRDAFSTVLSNDFDFPISLIYIYICMSGKECFGRIVHFCFIGMEVLQL